MIIVFPGDEPPIVCKSVVAWFFHLNFMFFINIEKGLLLSMFTGAPLFQMSPRFLATIYLVKGCQQDWQPSDKYLRWYMQLFANSRVLRGLPIWYPMIIYTRIFVTGPVDTRYRNSCKAFPKKKCNRTTLLQNLWRTYNIPMVILNNIWDSSPNLTNHAIFTVQKVPFNLTVII